MSLKNRKTRQAFFSTEKDLDRPGLASEEDYIVVVGVLVVSIQVNGGFC